MRGFALLPSVATETVAHLPKDNTDLRIEGIITLTEIHSSIVVFVACFRWIWFP